MSKTLTLGENKDLERWHNLRSQFCREPKYKIGETNLVSRFTHVESYILAALKLSKKNLDNRLSKVVSSIV